MWNYTLSRDKLTLGHDAGTGSLRVCRVEGNLWKIRDETFIDSDITFKLPKNSTAIRSLNRDIGFVRFKHWL